MAILLDPGGATFRQERAHDLATRSHLILVCPRYEGVDERIRGLVDLELSIGDYVLSGGELPALVVIDAVIRLLPGAIDDASTEEESFADGLLEYPQYTRPPSFPGKDVPAILVSGDHGAVRRWRQKESLRRTLAGRPDLLVGRHPVERKPSSCGSSSRTPTESESALTVGRRRAILRRRPPRAAASLDIAASPRRAQTKKGMAVNVLDEIVSDQLRTDLPELASGDTVKVSAKVVEGNRERIQVFEGTVMRLRGGGITRSITVRRIASGVGVERTFKIHSPADREDRGRPTRPGSPGPAVLPAQARRQGRDAARARPSN